MVNETDGQTDRILPGVEKNKAEPLSGQEKKQTPKRTSFKHLDLVLPETR